MDYLILDYFLTFIIMGGVIISIFPLRGGIRKIGRRWLRLAEAILTQTGKRSAAREKDRTQTHQNVQVIHESPRPYETADESMNSNTSSAERSAQYVILKVTIMIPKDLVTGHIGIASLFEQMAERLGDILGSNLTRRNRKEKK